MSYKRNPMTCGLLWLLSFPRHVSEAHPRSGGWGSWGRGASLVSRPCSVVSWGRTALWWSLLLSMHVSWGCFHLGQLSRMLLWTFILGAHTSHGIAGLHAPVCVPCWGSIHLLSTWPPHDRRGTCHLSLFLSCVIMLVLLGVWGGIACRGLDLRFPGEGPLCAPWWLACHWHPLRLLGPKGSGTRSAASKLLCPWSPYKGLEKCPFGTLWGWYLLFFVIKFARVQRMGFLVYCKYQLSSLKQFLAL